MSSTTFSVITSIANLPYDAQVLVPCAVVGGLVVLTPNSVVYVDQVSKRLVLPVNGWAGRVSDLAPVSTDRDLMLEGSRATFISDTTLVLILADGTMYTITLALDGKVVSGLSIADKSLAKTTIPSIATTVGDDLVFVTSTQGPSVLLKANMVEEEILQDVDMYLTDTTTGGTSKVEAEEDVDMYDDDAGK